MVILSQKTIFGNYGLQKMEVLHLPLIIDDYGSINKVKSWQKHVQNN
jgi:hypothetical protein